MIKFYCDKCGKETTRDKIKRVIEEAYPCDAQGNKLVRFPVATHDLCEECYEQYEKLNIDIKDFMAMTDEEIELALYTFKVGDKVITSTGKVGTITEICTCDQCKKRGFYEPQVKVDIGTDSIWITDNDKRVNFRSFYQIGDYIFGNIDEDCVVKQIGWKTKEIKNAEQELAELQTQLDIVKKLK